MERFAQQEEYHFPTKSDLFKSYTLQGVLDKLDVIDALKPPATNCVSVNFWRNRRKSI